MYESWLQELGHERSWNLPTYSTAKDGADHNPRFKASVCVNCLSFHTADFSRTSKEAQNEAAKIAFDCLIMPQSFNAVNAPSTTAAALHPSSSSSSSIGPSSGVSELNDTPISRGLLDFKTQDILIESPLHRNGWSFGEDAEVRADISLYVKDKSWPVIIIIIKAFSQLNGVSYMNLASPRAEMTYICRSQAQRRKGRVLSELHHMYKNQLQHLAQKRNLFLPIYTSLCDGQPHAPPFKATVTIDGQTFESPEFFSTLREAEHAAAKVALTSLSAGVEEDESGFFKNLLQQLAQKEGTLMPVYKTIRSGASHLPTFFSTVEVEGVVFSGKAAKTKKQAEMNAAKVAWFSLQDRRSSRMPPQESLQHLQILQPAVTTDLPKITKPSAESIPFASPKIATKDKNEESTSDLCRTPARHSVGCQTEFVLASDSFMSQSIPVVDSLEKQGLGTNSIPTQGTRSADVNERIIDINQLDDSSTRTSISDKFCICDSMNEASVGDEVDISNLAAPVPKPYVDIGPQNLESSSSPEFMMEKKKPSLSFDTIYSKLRDVPADHLCPDDGISSSTSSECSDRSATDLTSVLPTGSDSMLLGNRIRVYPRGANVELPQGAIQLPISDDQWIAARLECA